MRGKFQAGGKRRTPAKKKKKSAALPIVLGVLAVLLLLTGCVGYFLLQDPYGDQIHPNVSACGVDLGGMTQAEAEAALRAAVGDKYATNDLVVTMTTGDPLVFRPEDTNVRFDAAAAAQTAFEFGRSGSVFSRLFQRFEETTDAVELDTDGFLTYDEAYVRGVAEERAQAAVKDLRQPTVEEETETVTVTDAEGAETEQTRVSGLKITTGVSRNDFTAEQIEDAVRKAYADLEFEVELTYPAETADEIDVETLYAKYHVDAVDAHFDTATQAVVPEIVGCDFDKEALLAALETAEPGAEIHVDLLAVQPAMTAEQLKGELYKDVLGSCDTAHTWINDRTHNLILACAAIDGKIVMPGEVFSFNQTVGERTEAKGYRAAIVYVGGHSKPEIGGGVCQVASTIYSACLYADLEIVESTCHQFFCTYTNPGMDATIYWGHLDYKFRNNTPFPLKILASVSDGKVHIKLMGTETKDYTVKMSWETTEKEDWETVEHVIQPGEDYKPGEVIDTPYTGYTVKTYMSKIDKDGNVISKTLVRVSHYSKRDKVIAVAKPGDLTPKPTDPTDPPATDPPATDPPATDPPATDPPATDPPATDPPATDPPATDPPATDPPATDPPATDPPAPPEDPPADGG